VQSAEWGERSTCGSNQLIRLGSNQRRGEAFPRGHHEPYRGNFKFEHLEISKRRSDSDHSVNMHGAADTIPTKSDRECLEGWRREREAENLRPIVERYLGLVFSSAFRRTGSADEAAEVTRAVFLVLARRSRKAKTVLAAWLFELTRVACRNRTSLLRRFIHWFRYKRRYVANPNEPLWTRVAPVIDRAMQRLRVKQRNAVLLRGFLNYEVATAAAILRSRVPRVERRFTRGMRKLARRLHTRRAPVDSAALTAACATEASTAPVPDGLALGILEAVETARGGRPRLKIARRTLRSLFWGRWRRRVAIGLPLIGLLVAITGATAWWLDRPTGYSRLLSTFIVWSVRLEAMRMGENPRPWPSDPAALRLDGTMVRNAGDIYKGTNIWLTHLRFTREQAGRHAIAAQPEGTAQWY
jgi:DNA-directed RNA polymerase specialized sigma24 family protein